jgi:hypothetical protein
MQFGITGPFHIGIRALAEGEDFEKSFLYCNSDYLCVLCGERS